MNPEPILVVKRTRRSPDALRRLVGKAGRRDGLFARDTHDPYLVCGGIEVVPEGGGYRVVLTLWPVPKLDRPAIAGATTPGKPERYEDAIYWRGVLGDDWERGKAQELDHARLQRRLRP